MHRRVSSAPSRFILNRVAAAQLVRYADNLFRFALFTLAALEVNFSLLISDVFSF